MSPCYRFPAKLLQTPKLTGAPDAFGWKCIHTEALAKITGQVDPHCLYGHLMTVVFSPEYYPTAPVVLLNKLSGQTIVHVHRSGYHLVTTAYLTQGVQ